MKNWKGSTGKWKAILNKYDIFEILSEGLNILSDDVPFAKQCANAKLIADAGTTISKCDFLPSELLEQRDDLVRALNSCIMSMRAHPDNEEDSEFEGFINNGLEAINKTKTS